MWVVFWKWALFFQIWLSLILTLFFIFCKYFIRQSWKMHTNKNEYYNVYKSLEKHSHLGILTKYEMNYGFFHFASQEFLFKIYFLIYQRHVGNFTFCNGNYLKKKLRNGLVYLLNLKHEPQFDCSHCLMSQPLSRKTHTNKKRKTIAKLCYSISWISIAINLNILNEIAFHLQPMCNTL